MLPWQHLAMHFGDHDWRMVPCGCVDIPVSNGRIHHCGGLSLPLLNQSLKLIIKILITGLLIKYQNYYDYLEEA